jgi:broad specificity phosphatase PhoE
MGLLFLVRHATTAASAAGRNLGQLTDAGLTPEGRLLADRLGCAIAWELTGVQRSDLRLVTSPAQRCRETADAIARATATSQSTQGVTVEPELRELAYGAWEGLTPEECRLRDPGLRAEWEADPYAVRAPGGESGADVAARSAPVLAAVDDWVRDEPGRVAVVVSHNHVIRLRLAWLLGLPPADYRRRLAIEPGSYSLIDMVGGERPPADGATIRRLGAMAVGREC